LLFYLPCIQQLFVETTSSSIKNCGRVEHLIVALDLNDFTVFSFSNHNDGD